jgi:hypothetical protein
VSKFPPPKFYATDKDVHDLFSRISADDLLTIAKSRGIILSHSTSKDSVVSYLARQTYSHQQLRAALAFIESDEKEEKVTPSKVDSKADLTEIAQAFEKVRENRKDPDERMTISQRDTGELEVKVNYTHVDVSQATLRQVKAKEITFVVSKAGDVADFTYNNNPKAAEIYAEVKNVIKGEAPISITECVSLKGVTDPGKRVQFFIELMNGMLGFRLRSVPYVKAERMGALSGESTADEAEKENVEEMVKKMALTGGSVWNSPEFSTMVKNGFFVYNARWLGTELDGENRNIEFDAGFSTGDCLDFSIRVLGVYKRKDDGLLEKKLTPLSQAEREKLRRVVQDSAFEALEKIRTPQDQPKAPQRS